jgi:hypothetical protein
MPGGFELRPVNRRKRGADAHFPAFPVDNTKVGGGGGCGLERDQNRTGWTCQYQPASIIVPGDTTHKSQVTVVAIMGNHPLFSRHRKCSERPKLLPLSRRGDGAWYRTIIACVRSADRG